MVGTVMEALRPIKTELAVLPDAPTILPLCTVRSVVERDYIGFYMGTIGSAQWADLMPVYRMIFRCLKAWLRLDVSLSQTQARDLRPLRDALREQGSEEWNQEASVPEAEEHERSLHELCESLDMAHREAVTAATEQPAR